MTEFYRERETQREIWRERDTESCGIRFSGGIEAKVYIYTVATAFVDLYYKILDTNPEFLAILYQEWSMLTFEGQKIQGSQSIVSKLTSLPFRQCKRSITNVDCQPSGPAGGILIFVSGNLHLAGEQHARKFSQMFHLMSTPQGSFYVLNDIFRLNYA